MKVSVTIQFEIQTSEYHGIKATANDAKKLVEMMLTNEADFPALDEMTVRVTPIRTKNWKRDIYKETY